MYCEIEALLLRNIGLDARSLGDISVPRAIDKRMAALGITDLAHYELLITSDRNEMDALIEGVVVPETWFFRGAGAFEALKHFACHEWAGRHAGQQLRILSVPCSTGEEPYSIAMALLDAGLSGDAFHIDALDISRTALLKASHACYGSNSFRGAHLDFRERYFQRTDAGYRLQHDVAQRVNFHKRNILDDDFTKDYGGYDVIFCRNLLIYFDAISRNRVIDLLLHLLNANGLLFLGHADSSMKLFGAFVSTRYPMAFSFRKRSDERRSSERAERRSISTPAVPLKLDRRTPVKERRRFATQAAIKRAASSGKSISPKAVDRQENRLETAALLADAGKLEPSEKLCLTYISEHGPSAQAYFLLAMISNVRGKKREAAHLFRKTIYLEPNHYQALVCLSIMMDEEGNPSDAGKFRQRSERALQRQAAP